MGNRFGWTAIVLFALVIGILLVFAKQALPTDRCEMLVQDVRVEHTRYFGIQFPWHYSVAQLSQESACRANITSFDGGAGLAQMMPKTSQYIQSLMGEKLNPYNARDAIRMQAFYMYRIHTKENWTPALFVDFRIYNGGRSALYGEYQRAGILDPEIMHIFCQRKKIQFKWGVLDLCVVNKEYAEKIYRGGQKYKRGPDGMRFW